MSVCERSATRSEEGPRAPRLLRRRRGRLRAGRRAGAGRVLVPRPAPPPRSVAGLGGGEVALRRGSVVVVRRGERLPAARGGGGRLPLPADHAALRAAPRRA